MNQHKWHKEIKAWSDGAEIECKDGHAWWVHDDPDWSDQTAEYRIKPQPVEPQYLYAYFGNKYSIGYHHFVSTAHPKGMREFEYIGKIPLIVESNDD